MASLDITSLFTDIPLDETMNSCLNESFDQQQCVSNLDRVSFEKLLWLAMKESFLMFDKTFNRQYDDVAIGSPLSPTFANFFYAIMKKDG